MASQTYLICTGPRAGSTLLADGLASTGRAGRPAEFFDVYPHNESYWKERLGIENDADYVDKVVAASATPNGVFGVKLHWHQSDVLRAKLSLALNGASEPAALDTLLRAKLGALSYVWLRRKNKVAQGISYYRASHTGIWQAVKGRGDQATPLDRALDFDFDKIDQHVRMAEEFDRRWADYFRGQRLTPLMLVYEEFINTYEATIFGVLKFLGLSYEDVSLPALENERQADRRSLDWEERYRQMTTGRSSVSIPALPAVPQTLRPKAAWRGRGNEPAQAPLGTFIAYAVDPQARPAITTAPSGRAWMDRTPRRAIYRCLPMLIANQSGWLLLNPREIAVTWNGKDDLDALTIEQAEGGPPAMARSHFGCGILTFTIPYLFRTPPGYNLHVRGPANSPKDGIQALEGIVETDWSEATFTMNWKLTRPGHRVVFEEGEPIAMVVPVRRGELEQFRPEIRPLSDDPSLEAGYRAWVRSRGQFNADLKAKGAEAEKQGWQRHYVRGTTVSQERAPEHQTGLALAEFAARRVQEGDR